MLISKKVVQVDMVLYLPNYKVSLEVVEVVIVQLLIGVVLFV